MTRKTLLLLLVLSVLAGLTPLSAQQKVGRWTIFPSAGPIYDDVAQAKDKTYFLNTGALHSLGDDNELYSYTYSNKLSEQGKIDRIFYNPEGGFLMVAYLSGNIDLIYDDGHVVNMPDIKDAVLSSGHRIHDAFFRDGKIYVGADFGFVIFDAVKHQVVESGIFNQKIDHLFDMGDYMVLHSAAGDFYSAPFEGRHGSLDKFVKHDLSINPRSLARLDDRTLIYLHSDSRLYRAVFNFPSVEISRPGVLLAEQTLDDMHPMAAGGFWTIIPGEFVLTDRDGNVTRSPMSELFGGGKLFIPESLKSVWLQTSEGIARYDATTATPTLLSQPMTIEGVTAPVPAMLTFSPDGDRLYINNYECTFYFASPAGDDMYTSDTYVSVLKDGHLSDAIPSSLEDTGNSYYESHLASHGTRRMIGGVSHLAVDPDDPSIFYLTNMVAGVFVIKDRKVIQLLYPARIGGNTPAPSNYSAMSSDVRFDQEGNLWINYGHFTNEAEYYMLPAAKRRNITSVQESDWIRVPLPDTYHASIDAYVTFLRKSNYNYLTYGCWGPGIVVMNNNGTPGNFADDRFIHHHSITDADGKQLNIDFVSSIVEDHNGQVWVSTSEGVFYIADPADGMSPSLTVKRPVVARNDGTNLGDYLLESDKVYQIAVDNSNRKWMATETSGVYLVSEDGTEILEHFTAENSELPSNCVYAVACDPNSNRVYFATHEGLVSYDSDSSPAAEDYSEVYAYPNPVRPDYTGWITISGLMDGSLVKIADSAGNVIFQTTSNGGVVMWDGCNNGGERVRTGVYYVLASQNSNGSSGCVTKIMVIK